MRLTQLFVHRPTLVTVVLALVLLGGAIAAKTLVQQQFPNVDIPTVSVRVGYPGASPTEIRDAIVRPIEDAIAGAPNLDNLTSSIQEGQASITATFLLSSNKTTDLVQVQRRVESARAVLPAELSAPTVASFDPSEPTVATLLVTSDALSQAALSAIVTNTLVPELEQADGVANVNANGVVTPAIEVNVDPAKLAASGATLADVTSSISNNNARLPGGIVFGQTRETTLDVRGDLTDPASVANLPVAGTVGGTGATKVAGPGGGTGTPAASTAVGARSLAAQLGLNPWSVAPRTTTIGSIADVVDGFEPKRVFSYVGGRQSITLQVQKSTGASEVQASSAVLAAIPVLNREYPQLNVSVINVQAQFTEQQIAGVLRTMLAAIVVTGIVMMFFLRSWRNAIVVMIAIPTSLLVTMIVMKLANLTIDTISLLAMTLIVGILVDDSIVVLENIERHYDDGEAPRTAAILGRSEIGTAAMVITLVDVVVFLPIAFLPGTVGRFLAEFALVVVVASLTSLAVSFTITPSLAGSWSLLSKWKPPKPIDLFTAGFERVRRFYVYRALRWALTNPIPVVAFCGLSTVGSLALIPLGAVGFEFMPRVDRGQVFMQIAFPSGTPLSTTQSAIAKLTGDFARIADVQRETGTAGAERSGFGGSLNIGSVGQIQIFLKNKPAHATDYWAKAFGALARSAYPKATIVAIPATSGGGGNSQPIDYLVETTEGDPASYTQIVADALKATPGAANVNTSLTSGAPQIDLFFDRERARGLDVDIATAANAVRASFGGALAAQIATQNGTKYVQVAYPQSDQTSLAAIAAIPVRARNGSIVHVGDIVQMVSNPSAPLLSRVNRVTVVHVLANVAPGFAQSNVQRGFMQRVAQLHLPSSVTIVPNRGGAQQNLADTVGGVGTALGLSFLLVFLLMVALYNSYRLPFIIMFAIPVACVGAVGSLWITHQTLNLYSMIGTVLLVGLVSKNGILLVELANQKLHEGLSRIDAVTGAAQERFRPIVMTTCSMIAGMAPLALALEAGSQTRRSLGIVVIGGLTSSLILTLLLVPIVFVWFAPKPRAPRLAPLPAAPGAPVAARI
ncbi:MAG: efflux RND transporter permease subunit [Vulcanimicrobiaceae bacterium]